MLYENKHRLYDDEEILDNIKHADELKQLLSRIQGEERSMSFEPSSRSTPRPRSSCPSLSRSSPA